MNTVEKMTKKEKYEMAIDLITGIDNENTDILVEFFEAEIAALEKKAVKAKEAAAKKKAEADELLELVYGALSDEEFGTIADIVGRLEDVDGVTVGKVQYRLNALARDGSSVRGGVQWQIGGGSTLCRTGVYHSRDAAKLHQTYTAAQCRLDREDRRPTIVGATADADQLAKISLACLGIPLLQLREDILICEIGHCFALRLRSVAKNSCSSARLSASHTPPTISGLWFRGKRFRSSTVPNAPAFSSGAP
jgi:hypothetical protein